MEIERYRPEDGDWHPKLRHCGQRMGVAVARPEFEALVEGENVTEVIALDALRVPGEALGRPVDAAVLNEEMPGEVASLRVLSDWE